MESREQLRSMFDRLRLERIEKNDLWWLQSRALLGGQEFLKYNFVVDRALEWFHLQVRSGTLHTRQVIQELYGVKGESDLYPHCKMESESILHCLGCKRAIAVRQELVIATAKELRGPEFPRRAR